MKTENSSGGEVRCPLEKYNFLVSERIFEITAKFLSENRQFFRDLILETLRCPCKKTYLAPDWETAYGEKMPSYLNIESPRSTGREISHIDIQASRSYEFLLSGEFPEDMNLTFIQDIIDSTLTRISSSGVIFIDPKIREAFIIACMTEIRRMVKDRIPVNEDLRNIIN